MYPYNTQIAEIDNLKKLIAYYYDKKYEIVMADETLFNPDKYGAK